MWARADVSTLVSAQLRMQQFVRGEYIGKRLTHVLRLVVSRLQVHGGQTVERRSQEASN